MTLPGAPDPSTAPPPPPPPVRPQDPIAAPPAAPQPTAPPSSALPGWGSAASGAPTPPQKSRSAAGVGARYPIPLLAVGVVAVLAVVGIAWAVGSGSTPGKGVGTPRPTIDTGGGPQPTLNRGGAHPTIEQDTVVPAPVGSEDDAIRAGTELIARACSEFAGANGSGPSVGDVRPDGAVAQFVDHWPTNPFTGSPMVQGGSPGDFVFNTAIKMPDRTYTGYVNGILSNGERYPVEYRY